MFPKQFCAVIAFGVLTSGCATPPSADPSAVNAECAQQCAGHLANCSSGFTFFPIVKQKQCNDTYDVCIKGCPARTATPANPSEKSAISDRLKALENLYESGAITKEEYAVADNPGSRRWNAGRPGYHAIRISWRKRCEAIHC